MFIYDQTKSSVLATLSVLILSLLLSACTNTNQSSAQPSAIPNQIQPGYENLKSLGGNGNTVMYEGSYTYTGDFDRDFDPVFDNIWTIAKDNPQATDLKLRIIISGANKYGETIQTNIGELEIDNLEEVKRFKTASYYARDFQSMVKVGVFIQESPNIRYKNNGSYTVISP